MADNKNEFRKSLDELIVKGKASAKAKIRVFTRPASARPSSARQVPVKQRFIHLTKLIAKLIPKPIARASAIPASRTVSRPPSRTVARPASRQSAAPAISLRDLHPDIMELVEAQLLKAENSKYTLEEYRFVVGIPEDEIKKYPTHLLQNKNALYYLTENANYKVNKDLDYYWLSSNTNPIAIELIKKALNDDKDTYINWAELCKNPSAADILLNPKYMEKLPKYREQLVWDALSKNTNPRVIKFLAEDKNKNYINWENLSANEAPEAIALLNERIKTHPWDIYRHLVSKNSGAIHILSRYTDKATGEGLSANTAEAAYNLLLKRLKENPKDINWAALSANPSKWAFDFLQKEENKKYIRWDMMSKNTNKSAIQLLKKQVEEENKLSDDEYKRLPKNQKIDWLEVSRNPSAIELIKERIKYEAELIETNPNYYYEILNQNEKISYSELATNPSIFVKERYARPVAASAIAPAARRTSPAPPAARAASARQASSASQAARVAAARVANNAKFNAELEQLRAQRKQLQNTHLLQQTVRASRTQQTAARTTARTLRAQTLAASRAEYRDIGRPIIRQPPRASGR